MRRFVAALACALVLVLSSVSFAAPGTPMQRAEALTKEGAALEKAGKKDEALAKFEEAYAIAPTGVAAYNLARVDAALGRHLLALQQYREALRDTKLPTDARRDAEAVVEELKTKIGIIILDVPESATTTVDAKEVDPKQPAEVTPGMHVVKIRLGGEIRSATVTATAGGVTPVKLRFGAEGPAGNEPGTGPSPPPTNVTPPPSTYETKWPLPKTVTVGAGAAVAAGLLTTSLVIFATADDAKSADPAVCTRSPESATCRDVQDRRDSYDSARTTSTIFFYSGLIVGALAAGVAVLWPNQKAAVSSTGAGSGGLSFRF